MLSPILTTCFEKQAVSLRAIQAVKFSLGFCSGGGGWACAGVPAAAAASLPANGGGVGGGAASPLGVPILALSPFLPGTSTLQQRGEVAKAQVICDLV